MTPTSRRFSKALIANFPRFARRLRIRENGDFEAEIPAPPRSAAQALVCMSNGTYVWVRVGPRRAFYSLDNTKELVSIVRALLRDDAHFVLFAKAGKWSGTTLVRRGFLPAQGVGESARIVSWSGRFDRRLRAGRKRKPLRPAPQPKAKHA